MRLYLRQRMITVPGIRNYDVRDESGQLLYVVEQQVCFPKKFQVYDTKNQCIGMVKRKSFRLRRMFELTQIGKTEVELCKAELGKRFSILPRNWVAKGSRFIGDFRIFDKSGTPVAVVEDGSWGCTIELISDVDHLTVLLFAIAVQRKKNR